MAGTPKKRARREMEAAWGKHPVPNEIEIEVTPRGVREKKYEVSTNQVKTGQKAVLIKADGTPDGRSNNRGASPEHMRKLAARRKELAAQGDKDALGGRPKTKFSRAEITERALERLEPLALKVLSDQIKNKDLDPGDRRAAAIKILEYRRGKPTQAVKMEANNVSTIRFETAAWIPGMAEASSASLLSGAEILELEAGDVDEEVEEDASDD